MSEAPPPIPDIDPAQFAEMLRGASDEDLATGLRTNGDLILGEIFKRMGEHVRADALGDRELVVEWRITAPGDGETRTWQVKLAPGGAEVERDGTWDPNVTLRVGGVDFLRLITGQAQGPRLFLTGRLRIKGDLMVAARLPSLFVLPGS